MTMSAKQTDGESEQVTVIDIPLNLTGDDESTYRTENDILNPWQRTNVTERKGAVDIRCTCLDIIHGNLRPDGDHAATLVVLEFTFDARRTARRIKFVNISLEFSALGQGEDEPEVFRIAPIGNLVLVPTEQTEETKLSAEGNVMLPPLAGFGAGARVGLEKNITRKTTDVTRVVGSIDLRGRNWGKKNSASWSLMENDTTKTGVPTVLRTAVLLKREHGGKFQCTFKINAQVDFLSSIKQMFGKEKDDPVLFNPTLKPTDNLRSYDLEALGSINLNELSLVTFMQVQEGVIQHVP